MRQGAGRGKRWNLGWILPWPWGYIQHIIKQNTTCDYWPPKAGCYDKWHCTEFCRHIRKDYLGIYHLFIDSKKITTTNMAMGPFTLAPWIFLCPQHAQDDVTSTWGSFHWQFIHFRLAGLTTIFLQNYITYILKPDNYLFVKPSCWLRKFCNSAHWKSNPPAPLAPIEQVWNAKSGLCAGKLSDNRSVQAWFCPWWKPRCEWPVRYWSRRSLKLPINLSGIAGCSLPQIYESFKTRVKGGRAAAIFFFRDPRFLMCSPGFIATIAEDRERW